MVWTPEQTSTFPERAARHESHPLFQTHLACRRRWRPSNSAAGTSGSTSKAHHGDSRCGDRGSAAAAGSGGIGGAVAEASGEGMPDGLSGVADSVLEGVLDG